MMPACLSMRRCRSAATLLATTLLLAACGGGDGADPVQVKAALRSFSGPEACGALERHIEDSAVGEMRSQLEAARDGVPGWGWWGGPLRLAFENGDVVLAADATAGSGGSGGSGGVGGAPADFTTTNNQVAGVDEPDIAKNDGTRILALAGKRLMLTRSWPPQALRVSGALEIEGYPLGLFLDGNRAVVLSSIHEWFVLNQGAATDELVVCHALGCEGQALSQVKITEVDIADPAAPAVTREAWLPGSYVSARMIDGVVRVVLSDRFAYPIGLKWWLDYDPLLMQDPKALRAAWDRLIEDNEKLIRAQVLDDWLRVAKVAIGGVISTLAHACGDFARVDAPTRLGMLTVATFPRTGGELARTTVLAEAGEVYASRESLYVATPHWWSWPEIGQENRTYLHKFDISDPAHTKYLASGEVAGQVVDQFSLDEAASGHLRAVTTIDRRVADPANPQNFWGRVETASRLTVLEQRGTALVEVGHTPDMAPGERVTGARILGDKGFVVTFRQVDPLFTLDLADPTVPKVVGELKIPGFSTYLHPIGPDHLLTIGTYVPEPPPGAPVNWQARALQLAIFDVSDLAAPRQTHTEIVGTAYGWSDAQFEHKAFNWFAAKGLLAIPFADWSTSGSNGSGSASSVWGAFTSDLRVFSVDPVAGFTPRGAITMADLYAAQQGQPLWDWGWSPQVRRSVMADDFVYAISDAGIRAAHVADLATPIGTATFGKPDTP